MEIPLQLTIPAQTFNHAWVAQIVGRFPLPQKQVVTDPETGDVATVVMPQDGQLQITFLPCNILPSGEVQPGATAQNKILSMAALMAHPGVPEALAVVSQAIIALNAQQP